MSFKKQKKGQNQHVFKKKPPQHIQNHDLESSKEHFIDDEDTSKWYDIFKDEVIEDCPQLSKDEVERLRTDARKLLDEETMLYNNRMAKGPFKSEGNWIRTIMNKGTVSDRIAAQTVAIQDSPLHTLPLLKNLISMAKVSKKNECIAVLDTLSELFLSDLLRPGRKLREFEKCPLALLDKYCTSNRVTRKSLLMHWYYEDQLKDLYRTFVSSLQVAAQDSVERTKEKAITAMYKLLAGNPEEESVLLRNLVNKFGDPSSKVASKAIYNLIQLLQVHPNMKFVVMQETEKLLFRPNIGHRAQYYGICFLSQFLLTKEDADLARNLILIYFSFFKACVKKGEVDSRLMSALLIGVNRAYPFAKEEMEKMLDHIDTMYRVVHNAAFNVSTFTLSLLFQVADFANSVSDRFYSALYRKMLDPQLATSSQQAMFLNVAYKALQKDEELNRVKVLIKRLLQISCYLPVPLVCGILYLVSQLVSKRQELLVLKMVTPNRVFADIDENEDEEEHYVDIKIEDTEESSTSGDSRVKRNEIKEKETFAENELEEIKIKVDDCEIKKESIPTWFHFKNMEDSNTKKFNIAYNPLQRNPLFAGGKYCFYTELLKLSQHFHPTVSLFAKQIIQGERIKYPGDPLQDFALPRFLDRFVYKNPKQSVKEVSAKHSKFSRKKGYIPSGIKSLRVDSANYLNVDDSRIPVDELFMYRYLKKKRAVTEVKVKKEEEEEDDSDVSSIASDEFNELLDNMMAGKSKDLDFAEEVGKASTSKGNKDDDDDDEEEEEDDEDEDDAVGDDESGGQNDSGSENELIDEDGILDEDLDDDAEDIVFDDSGSDLDLIGGSEEEDENELKPNKKKNHIKDKLTRKKPGKDSNVFVSAEEFSEMLDNMGASKLKTAGSSALSNRDNAGEKQLRWEANRDFWMKRKGKKSGKSQNKKRKWQGPASGRRNEKSAKKFKKK